MGDSDRPSRSEVENAATARLEPQRANASKSEPPERVSGAEAKAGDEGSVKANEPPTSAESANPPENGASANGQNGRSSLPALPKRVSASPQEPGSEPAAEGQGKMISD